MREKDARKIALDITCGEIRSFIDIGGAMNCGYSEEDSEKINKQLSIIRIMLLKKLDRIS